MLKKTIIFFLSVLMTFGSIPVVSASANNEIIVFGGSQSETFNSIVETADGNWVVVGESYSTDGDMEELNKGNADAIIVKYDSNGDVLWVNSFGGSYRDNFTSVTTTSDGNLVAVGYSGSTDGDMEELNKSGKSDDDAIIVKYDPNGNVIWAKSFGGSNYDTFTSVTSTPDGNLVAVGYSGSIDGDMEGLTKGPVYANAIIVKYDLDGNVLWKKIFEGSNNIYYESVTLTPDDNLVAVGYFYSTPRSSFIAIIVKHDLNGSVLWEKSFGGGGNDYYYSVASTPDGNLVAVGYSESTDGSMRGLNKGNYDAIIVKYNLADGKEMWKKSFGGSGGDYYTSVASTPDGNLVAVGRSGSTDKDMQGLNKGGFDAIIVKHDLNNDGNVIWAKSFGGRDTDRYHSVTTTSDGDLVAVGYSSSNSGDMQGLNQGGSDAIIVKYDPNGNIVPFSDSAPEPASFSADITDQGVIVTINYPEQAVVRQYKINDGDWQDYTSPVVMTQNGTIYARGQAANGMWSEISTYVVSNIVDEEDPVGEGPGENDPEEEGPDAGNPIGSHPISCNTDGMCDILPGMNKIHKTKYILAQRAESVDIATLVPSNYDSISALWN